MSTIIPKRGFISSTPIDVDEVNENIEIFVQEIQGNLGEHNWAEDAFVTSDITEGAIARTYSVSQIVNWFQTSGPPGSMLEAPSASVGGTLPTDGHKVSVNYEWATIAGMEITQTLGNVILWVTFTAQVDFSSSTASGITYSTGNSLSGLQIGIFVDGALVTEAATGSMDRSNDTKGEGHHFKRDPVTIDCVVPVLPGSHTISARARMARPDADELRFDSSTDFYAILNRQLYIVEMR